MGSISGCCVDRADQRERNLLQSLPHEIRNLDRLDLVGIVNLRRIGSQFVKPQNSISLDGVPVVGLILLPQLQVILSQNNQPNGATVAPGFLGRPVDDLGGFVIDQIDIWRCSIDFGQEPHAAVEHDPPEASGRSSLPWSRP